MIAFSAGPRPMKGAAFQREVTEERTHEETRGGGRRAKIKFCRIETDLSGTLLGEDTRGFHCLIDLIQSLLIAHVKP